MKLVRVYTYRGRHRLRAIGWRDRARTTTAPGVRHSFPATPVVRIVLAATAAVALAMVPFVQIVPEPPVPAAHSVPVEPGEPPVSRCAVPGLEGDR